MSLINKIKEFEVLLSIITKQFNEIKREAELLCNNKSNVFDIDKINLKLDSYEKRLSNLEDNNIVASNISTTSTISNNVKFAIRSPKKKNISVEQENTLKEKELNEKILEKEKFEKGKLIAESGLNYELGVYNLLKNLLVSPAGEYFNYNLNTQTIEEIKDTNKKHDIICNYFKSNKSKCEKIPIELKKYRTPDWSQISIEYDETNKCWVPHNNSKVCKANKQLLAPYIKNMSMYDNKNPVFYSKTFKVAEWNKYKEENPELVKDYFIDIPNDTIKKLYKNSGCYYIQVSDGYGLYHLGNDIYRFGVPEFICEQVLRIRVKRCGTRRGSVRLKLVMSPQPKNNCSTLPKSPYSLDKINKLPKILHNYNK